MPNESLPEISCTQSPGDNVELGREVTNGKINKESVAEQGVHNPSSNVLSNEIHPSSTQAHDESNDNGQDIELRVKPDKNSSGISTSNKDPSTQEDSESFAHNSMEKAPGPLSWLRSFLDKSNIWTRNIHGECRLPEGYNVAMLPSNATLVSSSHQDPKNISISCSHSIPKIVVAIVQATYASITVYRSRGDQTDRFGYAAFGFTVLPYIVMSLVNLLGSLLLPDYPTLYIVHSLESDEATLLGGTVDGAVGRLVQRKDVYLNFLHDSSVREEDGEQYSNSIDGGDVTADHSMRTGSRQSHNEENSPRLRLPQEAESAGFTASVIASPLSSAFDMNNNANYEQHRDNQEEAHDSVPQEEGPSKILLTGDDEDITYRSATHVKRLKSNPPDQHSHYTPFATNGDTEGWPNNIIVSHNVMLLFAPAIPLGVIGGMTHFHKGHSTTGQRAWTMTWLALNGLLSPMFEEVFDPSQADSGTIKNGVDVVRLIVVKSVFAVPAIGGFVTVGQMVREYGSCTVLDGL